MMFNNTTFYVMLNDHIKVPLILLIIGLSSSLTAQIPDNFVMQIRKTK